MATQTHKVLRGESLSIIAKNNSVDISELAKENALTLESRLSVGLELKMPDKKIRVKAEAKPDPAEENSTPNWLKDFFVAETTPDKDIAIGKRLVPDWVDELLGKLRATEANERVLQKANVDIKKTGTPASYSRKIDKTKHSKKTSKIEEVKKQMKESLKEPHVITLSGVKLTDNEKRQIVASVAMCEMSGDGYGSINADQEFRGRKWSEKGIETGYSRIVHIGLSYGLIQYTQDGGALGSVLKKMYEKDQVKFIEIFGAGDPDIAKSLIEMTTKGHPDVRDKPRVHLSGLEYWHYLTDKKAVKSEDKEKAKELLTLSTTDADKNSKSDLPVEMEIRGIYVQPLVPNKNEIAIDIWTGVWKERFLAAGKVAIFQEAQLDYAVENYLIPVLSRAKKLKVRTALALAFLVACNVRGAPMVRSKSDPKIKITLLEGVANDLGITTPFVAGKDEVACIKAIGGVFKEKTKEKAKVGNCTFAMEEARRAGKLMEDQLGFMAEDLYDITTYV